MTTDHLKKYMARRGTLLNGVHYLSSPGSFKAQEDIYLEVRRKEGRVYPDAVVHALPVIDQGHPLFLEWRIRETSLNKLLLYLEGLKKPCTILDVGCGNGWMAHRVACRDGCEVYGLDTNQTELEQGARVFSGNAKLYFVYGDLFEDILLPESMDLVTLAGSVQYFPSLPKLLERLFLYLKRGGEIHLIDSPLYSQKSAGRARDCSRKYYAGLGNPEMASFYHHHLYADLDRFKPEFLYKPKSPLQRIRRRFFNHHLSPFPWIKIVK